MKAGTHHPYYERSRFSSWQGLPYTMTFVTILNLAYQRMRKPASLFANDSTRSTATLLKFIGTTILICKVRVGECMQTLVLKISKVSKPEHSMRLNL